MKKNLQKGFAHLGLLLLLLVVVVIALVGYKVVKNRQPAAPVTSSVTAPASTQSAQPIKTTSDLNSAESTLNGQKVDSDLNPDNYNQDVQSLY